MMVLCFLMSIPLKMMAETVTVHFFDNGWSSYDAYVYDISTDKPISTDHGWPGNRTNYTTETINNQKVVTWTIDLGSCSLANARIVFNNGSGGKGNQYPESGGFEVANNQYYNNIGKTDAPSEGGGGSGTGGGGSTGPTEKWDTETTNRLTAKPRIYSQGFYLAGNFFTFDKENEINYDDAVFKFQQQKDQDISIAKGAKTVYEVYKVEIPASLKALAQVMYVDEFGKRKYISGPGSACEINKDKPQTDTSIGWFDATTVSAYAPDPITLENANYWNFVSRNETEDEYSDALVSTKND